MNRSFQELSKLCVLFGVECQNANCRIQHTGESPVLPPALLSQDPQFQGGGGKSWVGLWPWEAQARGRRPKSQDRGRAGWWNLAVPHFRRTLGLAWGENDGY
jgi:hypothetical protein